MGKDKQYEQELYKTTDLYLASFLKAKSWFVRIEKEQDGKCTFIFVDDPDLREDIVSYFNDGEIGVNRFKNCLQDLKTLMYNV